MSDTSDQALDCVQRLRSLKRRFGVESFDEALEHIGYAAEEHTITAQQVEVKRSEDKVTDPVRPQ